MYTEKISYKKRKIISWDNYTQIESGKKPWGVAYREGLAKLTPQRVTGSLKPGEESISIRIKWAGGAPDSSVSDIMKNSHKSTIIFSFAINKSTFRFLETRECCGICRNPKLPRNNIYNIMFRITCKLIMEIQPNIDGHRSYCPTLESPVDNRFMAWNENRSFKYWGKELNIGQKPGQRVRFGYRGTTCCLVTWRGLVNK